MPIDWNLIISIGIVAGTIAALILKFSSPKIKKQLNGHEFQLVDHKIKITKLEDDSDRYRTATVRLSTAIKDLEKLEKKFDKLSEKIEDGFREVLMLVNDRKDNTSKKV